MLGLEETTQAGHCDSDISVPDVLDAIQSSYGRGCLKFTGRPLEDSPGSDRRSDPRHAIEIPFYLWPAAKADTGFECVRGEPIIAVTRDLSARGVGFRYDVPLSARYVVAEFDCAEQGQIRLLVEVLWRHKQSKHSFLAGGRVLQVLPPGA